MTSPDAIRRSDGDDVAIVQPPGLFTVLRIPAFRRLWINLSLSSLGDWLGLLATTALAYALVHGYSHQAYAVGGILIVRLLPALVIGPFAGAFVDRFDRRYTMVVADIVRFGLYASIPLVRTLSWLFIASFLTECFSLFWIPAKEASVPNLVPRDRLEAANQLSLISSYGSAAVAAGVFSLVSLLNSALAAGLPYLKAKTNSVDLALYFDAGTFLYSAYTVFRIPEISRARARVTPEGSEQVGMVRSISEGWRFIGSSRWLRGLTIGILGAVAAGAATIGLGRPFAADLGGGNAAYGTLFATVFLGLAIGMLSASRVVPGLGRRRLMGLVIISAGVALAVDAVMPNLLLAILMTFIVGFFAGITWVTAITLVGLEVSDDRRGRTFSFIYTVMRIDLLLVLATTPFIAGAIGPHRFHFVHVGLRVDGVVVTLLGAGVVCAVIGVACYRLMDDHPGVPLWSELLGAFVAPGRRHPRGVFVAFEGGDGAGKSTQVALLTDWLAEHGHPVVTTMEPGATTVGQQLRATLLDRRDQPMAPRTEALLYAADRAQHVDEVVAPALDRGAVVVTDRYVDSSLAYQGAGRTLAAGEVARLSRWATHGLVPDLTVVLDVSPQLGLARRRAPLDRIESEPTEFHDRVRARFLELARRRPHRYLVVDAGLPADEVASLVRARVEPLLPKPVTATAAEAARPAARADL
ncbi:MAG TPA: dTMP kinase [Mycobacteriales bacterium]|nr:dTMP kinase [Mycobacteriales bacterium]